MWTSPFCFSFSSCYFNQPFLCQIAQSKTEKSQALKHHRCSLQPLLLSLAWCAWAGMQKMPLDTTKIPSWMSLAVLGEVVAHLLRGPSLRKNFVLLPCYVKGTTSVMCHPPAAPVHPRYRIALYQAKKCLGLRCKYTWIPICLYSDMKHLIIS